MQKFNINWTAKTLTNMMAKGKVNFDNAVQRGLVWDLSKKSLLIHSMIYGYAIPAMYFTRDADGVYDSLDGKQRSNAISEFLSGEFALADDTPVVFDDDGNEVDIAGMTMEMLPEWAQDRVKDFNLTIYYYEDISQEEIRELFRRLNNGKPLTAIELTRVNTPCLEQFQALAKHPAIVGVTSDAAKRRFTDEVIAMQLYHLVTEREPDFSTKSFREWCRNVQVNEDVMRVIRAGLDAYLKFVESLDEKTDKKVLRNVKARTHFVSCAYFCAVATDTLDSPRGLTQEQINKTLREFFSGNPSVSEEYNNTVRSGSAKPGAVQTRKSVMSSLYANA